MRLLQWSRQCRKSWSVARAELSIDIPTTSKASTGAASAVAETKSETAPNVLPKVRIPLTCELLDEAEKALVRPPAHTSRNDAAPPSEATAGRLVFLLSKLPYELRLNIYEFSIPCMWHRRRRILLEHIVDCNWMATSQAIFYDAAPVVFTKSMPFIYTKLGEHETVAGVFCKHIERAFRNDSGWVVPAAQAMIERLAVTIRYPLFHIYGEINDLDDPLRMFFQSIRTFENLKTLYISLGPDYIVQINWTPNPPAPIWDGNIEPSMIRKLEAAAIALRQVFPTTLEVVWHFDRAAVPTISRSLGRNDTAALDYCVRINEIMEKIWREGYWRGSTDNVNDQAAK